MDQFRGNEHFWVKVAIFADPRLSTAFAAWFAVPSEIMHFA
jgi:hypothetical protein